MVSIAAGMRSFWRRFGSTLGLFVGLTGGAGFVYRAWGRLGQAPLDAHIDHWVHLMYVRNIQNGSLITNPLLGAPYGQHLLDFPTGNEVFHTSFL